MDLFLINRQPISFSSQCGEKEPHQIEAENKLYDLHKKARRAANLASGNQIFPEEIIMIYFPGRRNKNQFADMLIRKGVGFFNGKGCSKTYFITNKGKIFVETYIKFLEEHDIVAKWKYE